MTDFLAPKECPHCGRKESWSVWVSESGMGMATCHRATCGYGTRPLDNAPPFMVAKKKEPRIYTRPIAPLTKEQRHLIDVKFRDYAGNIGCAVTGYNVQDDRFLLPVFNGYMRRGYVAYSFNRTPKSLKYNEKVGEPFIHYALDGAPHIVIVEDWFSAEKVATTGLACGAAIMGTHLSQEAITELAGKAADWGAKVWVALDRDAYTKTLLYLSRFREQFPLGMYAWSLGKDLKYETTERIREALVDGRTNFNDRATTDSGNDGGSECL